ncbi:MAG TPA: hypothetical protein VFQ59_01155 [Candidatus Paceibacterota bacterium]|nr:hypothetical protein [Candidatus Paceibacterota bacterium]
MIKNKFKLMYVFIIAGLLFSGYLGAVKLFTNTCAFNESCPYFWGYPACWYGFGMYFLMFVIVSLALLGQMSEKLAVKITLVVSFFGILFAGSFSFRELLDSQITGPLGLSTCAYGLIFYLLIFIWTLLLLKKTPSGE